MKVEKKIYLLDDSVSQNEILVKRLERRGFSVLATEDHKVVEKAIELKQVRILLLDILMPAISGLDVLKEIRKKFSQIELPVIMVTAQSDKKKIVRALKEGANDYVTKPIDFEVLVTRIHTQIQISSLSEESARLQESEAINAMVATYNHEINNPLTTAMINLEKGIEKQDFQRLKKSLEAMKRIAEIVKRIRDVTRGEVQYADYLANNKMVNLNNPKRH